MKSPLIYIVDNDLISAFDIKIRIHQSQLPCRVKSFEDTDAAFEMLDSNYGHDEGLPDIMLVNFNMPEMNGLSFLEGLENSGLIGQKTDLYIFSTFGIPEYRKEYNGKIEIKGFFKKPLTTKEIRTIFADYQDRAKGKQISA